MIKKLEQQTQDLLKIIETKEKLLKPTLITSKAPISLDLPYPIPPQVTNPII
jgi:hypothetical protein